MGGEKKSEGYGINHNETRSRLQGSTFNLYTQQTSLSSLTLKVAVRLKTLQLNESVMEAMCVERAAFHYAPHRFHHPATSSTGTTRGKTK